nr:hypothetical protein BaRGS_018779 [Batillaria attramentaria]
MGVGSGYECGGFIDIGASVTGTIQSPNYPGSYPTYARCVWILEAAEYYTISLSIDFTGETYSGSCSDYIQVYDGGLTGTKFVDSCGTLSSSVVTSTGRWLYIYFKSDGLTGSGTGLSATYSPVYTGLASNTTNPVSNCRSYEFKCSNKLCISMSYRCDGYNDCGCGSDCDEDGCGGLPLSSVQQILIGVGVGTGVFVVIAFLGVVLEKHHNWEKQRTAGGGGSSEKQTQGGSVYKASNKTQNKSTAWTKGSVNKNASNAVGQIGLAVEQKN